jgi:RimJ/RimL family protein N-acetyltransferase
MDIPVEITTPRLRLYAPSLTDVEALAHGERDDVATRLGATVSEEWWLGPSLLRVLPNLVISMRREPRAARRIWMVILPSDGSVIGDIGFHEPVRDESSAEIGYSVVPQARGYGYTTEATSALLCWTFAQTTVTQVIAQIEPENVASLRVAAKLGMQELPAISTGHRCFGIARLQAHSLPA